MKKFFFKSLFVLIMFAAIYPLQAQSDIRNSLVYKLQRGVYNRAIKYNDIQNAITALYNICVLEPQNDSILTSLEYIYYTNRQYFSAILVANDALLLNPNNTGSREMKAVSLEQVGAKDKALEEYESLYLKNNNNIDYLYKMAILQFDLKRYNEAGTNVDILLVKKEIDSLNITLPKGDSSQQQVKMKANLYNLKGLIAQAKGNKDEAKKQYGMALEMVPDFYLARQNLDLLLKEAK
jgi:tetratricopeptide (TPR) repeat protein